MPWIPIGEVGVDSGTILVGDPSYWIKGEEVYKMLDAGAVHSQLKYDMGHDGKGVAVSSGYGDGVYPVYAKLTKEGRVAAIKIIFIEEE